MRKPLVSVIIPVFNRQELVKRTLESLLAQRYPHWECLIVDDGSTDNTLEVLKSYTEKDTRIKFWSRNREPKGAPTCRNIGLEQAKGEYVVFLDSDDYLLPHCLEQRTTAAKAFPDNEFWIFPMMEQNELGQLKEKTINKNQNHLEEFLAANVLWQTMCPLWKREFLLKLTGFTEGYPRFNDPELMIRAFLRSKNKYLIVENASPDAVLNIEPKKGNSFYLKVYKSIALFIPDILKHLEQAGKKEKAKHLVMYLWLWIKYYYAPQPRKKFFKTLNLIGQFQRLKIITTAKALELTGRFLYFHTGVSLKLKPKDVLTNKGYYL